MSTISSQTSKYHSHINHKQKYVLIWNAITYLSYLFLFTYSGVQHIVCCVYVFLHLLYTILAVPLDRTFFIAPSVFSNVCLTIYDRITNWHTQKYIILQKDIVQKTILPLNFFSLLIKIKYIKLRKKSSLMGIMKSLK